MRIRNQAWPIVFRLAICLQFAIHIMVAKTNILHD